MGNIEITTKLSRLKSVSSIDNDYLEAVTGGVLKNFVIFTGKHLCWSLFLIKLQACKFIEKRLQHWCFPLHVKKFLRTPILKNIRERLLLIILLVLSNLFVFGCLFTMIKKNWSFGEENVHWNYIMESNDVCFQRPCQNCSDIHGEVYMSL